MSSATVCLSSLLGMSVLLGGLAGTGDLGHDFLAEDAVAQLAFVGRAAPEQPALSVPHGGVRGMLAGVGRGDGVRAQRVRAADVEVNYADHLDFVHDSRSLSS